MEDLLSPITKTAVLCDRFDVYLVAKNLNYSPQSASRAGGVVDVHVVVEIAGEDAASDDGLSARGDTTGKKKLGLVGRTRKWQPRSGWTAESRHSSQRAADRQTSARRPR